jgi:hypothetical protein
VLAANLTVENSQRLDPEATQILYLFTARLLAFEGTFRMREGLGGAAVIPHSSGYHAPGTFGTSHGQVHVVSQVAALSLVSTGQGGEHISAGGVQLCLNHGTLYRLIVVIYQGNRHPQWVPAGQFRGLQRKDHGQLAGTGPLAGREQQDQTAAKQ